MSLRFALMGLICCASVAEGGAQNPAGASRVSLVIPELSKASSNAAKKAKAALSAYLLRQPNIALVSPVAWDQAIRKLAIKRGEKLNDARMSALMREMQVQGVVFVRPVRKGRQSLIGWTVFNDQGKPVFPIALVPAGRPWEKKLPAIADQISSGLSAPTLAKVAPKVPAPVATPPPAPAPPPVEAPVPILIPTPSAQLLPTPKSPPTPNPPPASVPPAAIQLPPEESPIASAEIESIDRLHLKGSAEIGIGILSRNLSYQGVPKSTLPAYSLPAGPEIFLAGDLYPSTLLQKYTFGAKIPWYVHYLGVTGDAQFGALLFSSAADGTLFPTRCDSFHFGLKARYPFGNHEISLVATVGRWLYAIDTRRGGQARPDVPDADYREFKIGPSLLWAFLPGLILTASGGYHPVFSAGEIQSGYFPHLNLSGIDFDVGVRVSLATFWYLRLSARYLRYSFAFNVSPTDRYQAGAASDEYFSAGISLGVEVP